MKKFLTALIAFVMCFSVVTTAFAATPDETSDSDLISDIKQAMLDTYYGDEKPDFIEVRIYMVQPVTVACISILWIVLHTGQMKWNSI